MMEYRGSRSIAPPFPNLRTDRIERSLHTPVTVPPNKETRGPLPHDTKSVPNLRKKVPFICKYSLFDITIIRNAQTRCLGNAEFLRVTVHGT